jgi:hypothetical protein
VAQIQDITSRKTTEGGLRRYTAQLNTLSAQDPLTGLSNQRACEAALEVQLSLLTMGGSPCSILLVGVHGDDAAISAAAGSLTAASRDTDLVAYLGAGDGDLRFSHDSAVPGASVREGMLSAQTLDGRAGLNVTDFPDDSGTRSAAPALAAYSGVPASRASPPRCGQNTNAGMAAAIRTASPAIRSQIAGRHLAH